MYDATIDYLGICEDCGRLVPIETLVEVDQFNRCDECRDEE